MKIRRDIAYVGLFLVAASAGYLAYRLRPHIRQMHRDRRLVAACKLTPATATEARVFVESPRGIDLLLGEGGVKKTGKGILFCSRSMSHHNRYGRFRGYIFINVNGRLFFNGTGPCDGAILRLPVHKTSDVDMSVFLAALKAERYIEIH
jgi:hypothetical protein